MEGGVLGPTLNVPSRAAVQLSESRRSFDAQHLNQKLSICGQATYGLDTANGCFCESVI
jgi:hypothetical protein